MSVSAVEGGLVPSDLPAKYQKLASEYAKIRAQFGVLKKAVVDEQSQNAELKENLRIKEQNLRKAEQELDSLNFRNQQLTKRVTILQEELDSTQSSSKSKFKGTSKEPKDSVIVEELQKKIAENENLVSMLHEQTEKYESEKFKLNQKVEMYEYKIKEYQSNLSVIENTKLVQYENETKQLLSKLNTKDEEIKKLQTEIKQLKNDLIGKNNALDESALKEKFFQLIKRLSLNSLFMSLSQFFQQMEYRFSKNMEESQFQKLAEINQRSRLMLQDFSDKYLLYCNIEVGKDFSISYKNLFENLDLYTSILEELSKCLICSKDNEVITTFKQFLTNVQKYWIQFSSSLKKFDSPDLSSTVSDELANCIPDIFRSFRNICDYFLSAFNEKFKSYQIHKESEKEILNILSNMSLECSNIFRQLTESSSVLIQVFESKIFKMKQKEALREFEQCSENWKQEIETLKAAHSKKIKDLEEQISCLSETTTPRSTNSGCLVQSPAEVTQDLDDVSEFENIVSDASAQKEEAEYLKYFNKRANKLVADRQYAESKVTVLKDECEALQRRLAHSLENRLLLEDSLKEVQNTASRLQEELQTTTINYEVQLQSMSEHMANMNEKLACQQEEIEILKHELNERFQGPKKGKSN